MRALHISIAAGGLYLWNEGTGPDGLKELKQSCRAIEFKIKILKGNTRDSIVWLPSQGSVPIPSSPLIGRMPDNNIKTRLQHFHTIIRQLEIEEALELCSMARDGNIADSGVIFGDSIYWIDTVLKAALKLVAEEKILPAMFRRDREWEARWVPVIGSGDERQIKKLSDAMPQVCRCMGREDKLPDMPGRLAINMLLTKSVDAIVRNSGHGEKSKANYDSLHDAWIHALTSKDAIVKWPDENQLYDFSKQMADWSRPIDIITGSPFNLCFRLSEPEEEKNDWTVDYLLQPKSDQSIYFPVSGLWKENSKEVKQLRKFGDTPIEFILAALGQASGLCPDISKSLKEKDPWGFGLDANGAFVFLKEYARALRASGFSVLLPSWWVGQGPGRNLGLKVRTKSGQMQSSGGLTLDSMIEFDYKASLGNEELTLEELISLAKMKAPLVKVRGQWTQIDPEQINSAIDILKKQKNEEMPARDLLAAALGSNKEVKDLAIDSVDAAGWLKDLLDRLTGRAELEILSQPDGFSGKLRPYQRRGFSWFAFLRKWGLGACLADDMGLGKTIQSLAIIQREQKAGEKRPVLVVCPTTVVNNWLKEAGVFTPELKVMVHHGSDRRKKDGFIKTAKKHAIVISSYGLLHRDIDFLKKIKWAGVILDEAQNIKNPETKKSKAARSLISDYRIALTGTPVENHVGDLWSIMEFLNPGLLGSQAYFKDTFYKPIQLYRKEDAAARLKAVTGPFILRRMKTDKKIISDLPEKMEIKDYCNLTKEQASLYKSVVDDMAEQIEEAEGINRKGLVLSTIMKLKQVCNHPVQFSKDNSSIKDRSGKLQRLEEMLRETLELGERTLVFTQFAHMGKILQKYLQDYFAQEVFLLSGSLSKKKRDMMVDRFQNDQKAPHIFILSLKAGGTGLNLTRANNVIHYDRWWNPAVENQATDRAFRIGQKKNVAVHKFIVAGTLEERIDDMIEQKTGIASMVIGTGEKWLTELSNEDFYEMIKLGSEAIGD